MDMELGGQKNSGYLEALLLGGMVGGQMRRHVGVPTDVQKDGRGILGQKNREVGRGSARHKKPLSMSSFFMLPTPLHPTLQE